MSKIFDALKRAEWLRARPAEYTDRRLSHRIHAQIPLFVYGYSMEKNPFYEDTRTLVINAQGGLMSMQFPVRSGQKLLLTNVANEEAQEAEVVSVNAYGPGRREIGFKFSLAAPQFWSSLQIGDRTIP